MQLNKYLAHAGICSRRKAVIYIESGQVTVNGKKVIEPGYKVEPTDTVRVMGKLITVENHLYIVLNKPKDCITTVEDERDRATVMDIIKPSIKERVYPVGRLDRSTTGVLLLTNDGALAQQLLHPKFEISKTYHVILNKPLDKNDIYTIKNKGVRLEDGLVTVDTIAYIPGKEGRAIRVVIHNGKYRIIRRLFESLGYDIIHLDRVKFAGITKNGLRIGAWRYLTAHEVLTLKSLSTESKD